MEKEKNIQVFEDEDATYCVIVGTSDLKEAEEALRKQEIEWYGENHEEEPIPIEDFGKADIYLGTKNGEENFHYWGDEPEKFFDKGKYETLEGFITYLD